MGRVTWQRAWRGASGVGGRPATRGRGAKRWRPGAPRVSAGRGGAGRGGGGGGGGGGFFWLTPRTASDPAPCPKVSKEP